MNLDTTNFSICAHVGLPKTGTTYLQRNFFLNISQSYYSTDKPSTWPKSFGWIYKVNKIWTKDFSNSNHLYSRSERESLFLQNINDQFSIWEEQSKLTFLSTDDLIFLSAEGFSGFSIPTAKTMANLLKAAGTKKIIFVFRKQTDWSISLWRQLILKENRFARFVSYEQLFGDFSVSYSANAIDMDWSEYLQMYQLIFGKENVLSLPYELLVKDKTLFYRKIKNFLNLSNITTPESMEIENPSLTNEFYISWKLDNHNFFIKYPKIRFLMHRWLKPLLLKLPIIFDGFFEHKKLSIQSKEQEKIMGQFKSSNMSLAELSGFDLKEYGYY